MIDENPWRFGDILVWVDRPAERFMYIGPFRPRAIRPADPVLPASWLWALRPIGRSNPIWFSNIWLALYDG